jgi:GAF domain-containing protein
VNTLLNIHREITLKDVLRTADLTFRNRRAADLRLEVTAIQKLAEDLMSKPPQFMRSVLQTALSLCHAGSVGISIPESNGSEQIFRWIAMEGAYKDYVGGSTPRHFSPCGTTADSGCAQLFYRPARLFTYFEAADPPIIEGLVIPFSLPDRETGTIWIVSHDEETKFDQEDLRIMTTIAHFAAFAVERLRDRICS